MIHHLSNDLEHICGVIKHAPESLDLEEVRGTLRRTIDVLDTLSEALADVPITIPGRVLLDLVDR